MWVIRGRETEVVEGNSHSQLCGSGEKTGKYKEKK
jgi:hypothetical protein